MKPTIKIQIPEPCSQSWDEMTPETGGRHCAACAKTVTDFTRMNDAQILELLHNSAGGCGRFNTDQVNRDLIALPAEKRFSFAPLYKLAGSILFIFSAGRATAQDIKTIAQQTDSSAQKSKRITASLIGDTTILTTKEIERIAARDRAEQVAAIPGVLQSEKESNLIMMGSTAVSSTFYIVDGVFQDGSGRQLKKWWQFWKRH